MKNCIDKIIILALFGVIMLFGEHIQAANNQPAKAKYAQILKKSDYAYTVKKYAIAAGYYEEYLKISGNKNIGTLNKLLDCYLKMHEYTKAYNLYSSIADMSNYTFSSQESKLNIAELLARYRHYDEAIQLLNSLDGFEKKARGYQAKNIALMMKDSLLWQVEPLSINTQYREYAPVFVGKELIFTSNRPLDTKTDAYEWDGANYSKLWKTEVVGADTDGNKNMKVTTPKQNTIINAKARTLADVYELSDSRPLNSRDNFNLSKMQIKGLVADKQVELVAGLSQLKTNVGSFTMDNDNKVYFAANKTKPDQNDTYRMGIMEGIYMDGEITDMKEVNFVNSLKTSSYMHPAVSYDGTLLVCASDMSGGKGGFDLYYAKRNNATQTWGELKPLAVNTVGNDVYPVIARDGYLYFSSNALPGLGGLDLYRIPLADITSDKTPVPEHLGYPVNSPADDFGLAMANKGDKLVITSDRLSDNDNLFLVEKTRRKGNPQITGYVKDKTTLMPIKDAQVFLWLKNSANVLVSKTNADGKYTFVLNEKGPALVKASKSDLGTDCAELNINVKPDFKDTIQWADRDLMLGNVYRVGYTWRLDNIHYDFNKWNIRPDAQPILDKVVAVLNENPITVELSSHTDSRGSDEYNMTLSVNRAQAAVDYIVSRGISRSRVVAKGYGETKLLNNCGNNVICSEAEHQLNRRTEVKVLNYTEPVVEKNVYVENITGQIIKLKDLPKDFFKNCNTTVETNSQQLNTATPAIDIVEAKSELPVSKIETPVVANALDNPGQLKGLFYVVVSSSVDKQASETLMRKLKNEGYAAEILQNNGRYRVAVKSATQDTAEALKNQLAVMYKDAWILSE